MTDNIKSIHFNGFTLKPNYLKINDRDGLHIKFKTQLPKEMHGELINFMEQSEYFTVKFDDADEVKMRFGLPHYSEHEDIMKYHLVLVSKEYDNNLDERHGNMHPNDPNKNNMIAFNSAYIEALEKKLVENNILTEEDLDKIKEEAKENIYIKKFEMGKIDDITKYDY